MYRPLIFSILLIAITLSSFAETAKVKWVIDGDTFLTEDEEKVRMIGINATEREEWFYSEAKYALIDKIKNRKVSLISDSKSPDKDKHGRLLRYVELDGLDINKQMIEEGWVYAFLRYPFDRSSSYREAEQKAKKDMLGLWSDNKEPAPKTKSDLYIYIIIFLILTVIAVQLYSKIRR